MNDAAQPPPRIVLADDEPDLRELIARLLTRDGFEIVGHAADGIQALQAVEDHDPDLLLLDLSMPQMDGLQVLQQLHGHIRPTVVILTGFNDPDLDTQARELGAAHVLHKGTDFGRLSESIRSLLEPTS